ncbi:hypothetical protein GQ600_2936 [Phytophthora cactorum]|nr:hypothetical protein GQ600_2936 [Phytophthora cactorum]
MGKNRHSKDRLFITQTEHKYLYGGKKQEIRRAYKRPLVRPGGSRALRQETPDRMSCNWGHCICIECIILTSLLYWFSVEPVTGKPLALKELIQLHFSKNSQGEYFCPVTYKVFTDNTKIAAIALRAMFSATRPLKSSTSNQRIGRAKISSSCRTHKTSPTAKLKTSNIYDVRKRANM